MMFNNKEDFEFSESIVHLLEGTLSKEKWIELEKRIGSDPSFAHKYVDFMLNHADLIESEEKIEFDDEQFLGLKNMELLLALAEYEKIAEKIEIEKPVEKPEKIKAKKITKISPKFPVRAAVLISVIFFLLLFGIYIIPSTVNVAFLADSIDAKWAPSTSQLNEGGQLYSTDKVKELVSGTVKIQYYYGAEVIVEGPAIFSCTSNKQLHLKSGKVYAIVPKNATGFKAITPSSTIIDLGTEFGVEVSLSGESTIQVYKGSASISAGKTDGVKKHIVIKKDQAKYIDSTTGTVKDISFNDRSFVRQINSQTNFIWRGEPINLADILGKGNGFGSGNLDIGIEPRNGQLVYPTESLRQGNHNYNLVEENPGIDGVFVPEGGGKRKVQITSAGHVFKDCPNTNNCFFIELSNNFIRSDGSVLSLGGKEYGTKENPCIFMQANLGITFDLGEIRKGLIGISVEKFSCVAGISETADRVYTDPDIWILIDGKLVYSKEKLTFGDTYNIDIELSPEARFLTLVTTDGGPLFTEEKNDNYADLVIFGNPYLKLESIK